MYKKDIDTRKPLICVVLIELLKIEIRQHGNYSGHLQEAKTTPNLFIFLMSGFNNYRYRALMRKVFVVELGAWSFNMGGDCL